MIDRDSCLDATNEISLHVANPTNLADELLVARVRPADLGDDVG
jgi:hypothetical protein